MERLCRIPIELIFWCVALIGLAIGKPEVYGNDNHSTLCPLAILGVDWCLGCGIGRSITQIFHGDLAASFEQHWFGVPALIIILVRIYALIKMKLEKYKKYKLLGERYV